MKIRFGRANVAVSVYMPKDCANNCPFCPSKGLYSNQCNISRVLYKVRTWNNTRIPEFVITGGEPMEDIEVLKQILNEIGNEKSVYINTTFLKKNLDEFIELVNSEPKIKGVNISRHCPTYEEDSRFLSNIAEDKEIERITKPVKINVIWDDSCDNMEAYLARWAGTGALVCFRRDFRYQGAEDLHDPYFKDLLMCAEFGTYKSHSQCDVCDTTTFEATFRKVMETEGGKTVTYQYHRGLKLSSIYDSAKDSLVVNDIIIFPNGDSAYDWDGKRVGMSDVWRRAREHGDLCSFPVANESSFAREVLDYEVMRSSMCGTIGFGGLRC